jgi:hypothetical protein
MTDLQHGLVLGNMADVADAPSLVEYAVAAEEAGWDGVFFIDHLVYPPEKHEAGADPWMTHAGIATRTDRIRLGSWVTPLPRRQPWQLARDLATLDQLSGGRVILGAGLGTPAENEHFGLPTDMRTLAERFHEALDVITGLWTGEPFSYEGQHYSLDNVTMLPTPVQEPRIPIVRGGFWPNRQPIEHGARWDGIAPLSPGIRGTEDESTLGGDVPDSIEAELRELVSYYEECADEPGDVFLPADFPGAPPDVLDTYEELGVTWALTTTWDEARRYSPSMRRIGEGPPK